MPSYAGFKEIMASPDLLSPTNVSLESTGAVGNLMFIRPLVVVADASKEPPEPEDEKRLILFSIALKVKRNTVLKSVFKNKLRGREKYIPVS